MGDPSGRFEDEFAVMRRDAYRTAFGVLGDAHLADDAASEALAQAWLHWSRIGSLDYRTAWVRRVTVNAAFRILRKRRRADVPEHHVDGGFEDEASVRLMLSRALLALPRRQREVVALRYLADLRDKEVAAALGISVNSVKTHLQRGLAALRSRIETEVLGERVTAALA
jgi:RNA polymerase sigma factor (sigma-70 family)